MRSSRSCCALLTEVNPAAQLASLALAATLAFSAPAAAQTFTWTGLSSPASGNWSNSANWSALPVSGINTTLFFGSSPITAVNNNIAGTFTLQRLWFNIAAPAYTLSGNPLSFSSNGSGNPPFINMDSNNNVTINNAMTLVNPFTIDGAGTGVLMFTGGITGPSLATSSNLALVFKGTNTFSDYFAVGGGVTTITDGGTLSSAIGLLGSSGSHGTVNIGGGAGSSSWTASGALVVGNGGAGTLSITGGGTMTSASGRIAQSSSSPSTVNVGGTGPSAWAMSGGLDVAYGGTGAMTITGGGTVSNTDGSVGGSFLNANGGTGTVNVGGGSGAAELSPLAESAMAT